MSVENWSTSPFSMLESQQTAKMYTNIVYKLLLLVIRTHGSVSSEAYSLDFSDMECKMVQNLHYAIHQMQKSAKDLKPLVLELLIHLWTSP
jgi:hypothetical protein